MLRQDDKPNIIMGVPTGGSWARRDSFMLFLPFGRSIVVVRMLAVTDQNR